MRGHLRERSPGRWAIVIDVRDPQTGKRKRRWYTFKGTKREAQTKQAELVASVAKGDYVEPSKVTVAEFLRARVNQWEAASDISARTAQRYRQLVENQIVPYLGTRALRKLRPLDMEEWHTSLRKEGRVQGQGGIAARTIGHAHRLLSKALRDAASNDLVTRNVAKQKPAPKVEDNADKIIVRDVSALVNKLRDWRLGAAAMVALFAGMRLGEVLALRWNRVDLDAKVVQVREALEQTKVFGVRFKLPKSRAGRRDITLPDILVDALRSTEKPCWSCACSSAPENCRTMRSCSQMLRADRSHRPPSQQHGPTSPRALAFRQSRSMR
jgi:integrase